MLLRFCAIGSTERYLLSLCWASSRGTPIISDGCHAKTSMFLRRSCFKWFLTFSEISGPIVMGCSGNFGFKIHFSGSVREHGFNILAGWDSVVMAHSLLAHTIATPFGVGKPIALWTVEVTM